MTSRTWHDREKSIVYSDRPNDDPSPLSAPPIFLPTFCQGIMEAPPKYASARIQPLQQKFPGAATDCLNAWGCFRVNQT